jgi:hypothetical protein
MRPNKFVLLPVTLVIAILLVACNLTSLVSGLSKPAATAQNANILFSDDFSDSASGWDVGPTDHGSTHYVDGGYVISLDAANYDLWGNPGKDFTDTVIDVDATKVAGPDDNDFGVICRYKDAENFYLAEVASDGYYLVGKYVGGTFTPLGSEQMASTDLVKPGNDLNHLQFTCSGDTLKLSINGTEATSVTDSDLTSGDVGLIAGDYDTAGAQISFDNLVVSKP